MFLKKTWYVAGFTQNFRAGQLISMTIADIPLVIFRTASGALSAMLDRCPHRFAPLSRGKIKNDSVECGYHGITFNSHGDCVANPCGPIVRALRVTTFRVVERNGLVWLWLGNPESADDGQIPDFWWVDSPEVNARFSGYIKVRANHHLLVDNILDLSHADFLHLDTLANATAGRPNVSETGDTVISKWVNHSVPAMPIHQPYLPAPEKPVDTTMTVWWYPGGAMHVESTARPTDAIDPKPLVAHAAHMFTPESEGTCHYFYTIWRNWDQSNEEYNKLLGHGLYKAFDQEDKPMIEAQQERIGLRSFESLQPALTAMDAGPTRARRIYDRLLLDEA